MSKITKEFEFELSESLTYLHEGGESKTKTLLFKAPSNSQEVLIDQLRKPLMKALTDAGRDSVESEKKSKTSKKEKKENDKNDKMDGATLLLMLYGADLDITEFKENFWTMILDDLCLVARRIKFTRTLLNEICLDDRDEILGEYTANFILPSWLNRLK